MPFLLPYLPLSLFSLNGSMEEFARVLILCRQTADQNGPLVSHHTKHNDFHTKKLLQNWFRMKI